MTTIPKRVNVFGCTALMLASSFAMAQPVQPTKGKNLALGKLCTFDPQPNYPDCTEVGDRSDLTDGIYNGCLVSEKGTVGWAVGYGWGVEGMPVSLIDIDLGDAHPIGEITFDSITAGSVGVKFPVAVRVFVSTDGEQYDLLCNILTDSMSQAKPLNHRFVADNLRGWGRYIRLAILPDAPIMFLDEIEIMQGAHTREQARHINEKPIPAAMVNLYAKQMRRGIPNLWSSSGYGTDRGEMSGNGSYYGAGKLGLSEQVKAEHPEFYQAAMEINRLLVQKSFLDEKLQAAKRASYYEGRLRAIPTQDGDSAGSMAVIQNESHAIDDGLNDLYQFYGRAFDAQRSVEQLSGVDARVKAVAGAMHRLDARIGKCIAKAASGVAARTGPWTRTSLELPPEQRYLNANGASRRYQFTAFQGAHMEPLWPLGPFDGFHIDHPVPWPESDTPGEYNFPKLRGYIERIVQESSGRITSFSCTEPSYRGELYPMTQWMLEKAAKNPDIILQTDKDKQAPVIASSVIGSSSQLNTHNPDALAYIRGYLKSFAADLSSQVKTDYFITGWEGSAGHVGYNPSSQSAFRDYLKERYGSIASLNGKWQTDYASFEVIGIPYDQYTAPAKEVSGLTYEFERWRRLNYVRLLADMRRFLREGAPNVPVMSDPSHFLAEGNGYLMYQEHACDIMSFHFYPGLEKPMWVYLNTMNRAFGKVTGYFENYYGMWAKAHLNDERLAKRDLGKFFFELFMRDVRVSAWWLGYYSHPTSYVVAYNGNPFGLDYAQTIYRWSATSLPVMFQKCRSIEKALLESRQETPKTAIIQPCATVFNLASRSSTDKTSDTLSLMFDLHNKILSPENIAHDYLPEEMVLDGKGSLDDYTVLFLPFAPYMSEELSRLLSGWVEDGGTLIAVGPFALKNEYGLDLDSETSMFKTLFPQYKQIGPDAWDYSVDGTDQKSPPAVTTKSFGKGRVVCLNRMVDVLLQDTSLQSLLTEIVKDVCEQTAMSPHADLQILVREGDHGEKYLGLCNDNVEHAIETTVLVQGKYIRPKDITITDWFPVPSRLIGDQTELEIHLEPGDWTMILLE